MVSKQIGVRSRSVVGVGPPLVINNSMSAVVSLPLDTGSELDDDCSCGPIMLRSSSAVDPSAA